MPHALDPKSELLIYDSTADLSSEERTHLEELLAHKLRGIPKYHIPDITLTDILHLTPRTKLANIPPDIGLEWFLRNRSTIDIQRSTPLKDEQLQHASITRAIFFYRLSPTHQFQRYHDATRWNLYIATALLTQATLTSHSNASPISTAARSHKGEAHLPPAALRFLTLYVAAVLEQHNPPSTSTTPTSTLTPRSPFTARENFIQLWKTSAFDLPAIHKSWARKALQCGARRLSAEWAAELQRARRAMGRDEYERVAARFEGSVLPGRAEGGRGDGVGRGEDVLVGGDGELLAALRVPCSSVHEDGRLSRIGDDEAYGVCDLRTAVGAVQSVRPRDMLPVLLRLFPPAVDAE